MAQPAQALDRNAFAFSRYDLQATVDPHQHALAVEGTIDVRNISSQPQPQAALQISSSLRWLAIQAAGNPVEWISQSYTSDIDHTGQLSEAIVKFEPPLPPGQTIHLAVRYSGTIQKDATRLERIGTPPEIALRSDWDEISASFTALRGVGYVVWYPVSMDAANLSQGEDLYETLRAWRERQASSLLHLRVTRLPQPGDAPTPEADAPSPPNPAPAAPFSFVGNGSGGATAAPALTQDFLAPEAQDQEFRGSEPVLVLLDDPAQTARPHVEAYYTAAHTQVARDFMASVEAVIPTLEEWFGAPRRKVVLVELTDPNALPYEDGPYYFVPMLPAHAAQADLRHAAAEVALTRPVMHAIFDSPRPWIREGLATFAQAIIRERQSGRAAALAYLNQFSSALSVAEADAHARPAPAAANTPAAGSGALPANAPAAFAPQPLITTADELFYRTKAAYVWWMLRDQLGDHALQSALAAYRPSEDRDTAYMQRLLERQFSPHRDLESFFDDWVYRDRGLPRLRLDSAYVRNTLAGQTVTAVTVENLGDAACEVPVFVHSASARAQGRLYVPARGKAIVRLPLDETPTQAEVNDGSVPEPTGLPEPPAAHQLPVTTSPPAH